MQFIFPKEEGSDNSDGVIKLGSDFAEKLNFTEEKFNFSYLWKKGDTIILSCINAKQKNQGALSQLMSKIWSLGYKIQVPIPSAHMLAILNAKGFTQISEDIWEK